jgi:hypothetical protein
MAIYSITTVTADTVFVVYILDGIEISEAEFWAVQCAAIDREYNA